MPRTPTDQAPAHSALHATIEGAHIPPGRHRRARAREVDAVHAQSIAAAITIDGVRIVAPLPRYAGRRNAEAVLGFGFERLRSLARRAGVLPLRDGRDELYEIEALLPALRALVARDAAAETSPPTNCTEPVPDAGASAEEILGDLGLRPATTALPRRAGRGRQ
jgi:hypothetical protein